MGSQNPQRQSMADDHEWHTAGGLVDEEHARELSACALIGQFSNMEDVVKFLHSVMDSICGKAHNFAGLYGHITSVKNLQRLVAAYTTFFSAAVAYSLNKDQCVTDLEASGLPADAAETIVRQMAARLDELKTALIRKTSTVSAASLRDFDWKLNMTVSSDKLSDMSDPKLLLSLTVAKADGSTEEVLVELPRDDLYGLLQSLDSADEVVQTLKV